MWRVLLIAAMLLPGCREAFQNRVVDRFTEPAPLPDRPPDTCYSEQLRKYVGQDAGVLSGLVFAQPVRILWPETPVTEDYSPARLNFDVNAAGVITRVWCG